MIAANQTYPRLTYLLRGGRRERLAETSRGPTEFFYGYQQLLAQGVDVSILEDSDVGMGPPLPLVSRLANKLSPFLGGLPVGMALSLLTKRGCRKLDGVGCVVATTNGMGMALAIAKAFGQTDTPVLLLAMGILPMNPAPLQIRLFGALSQHVHIACISRGEQEFLQELLPTQTIHYIPFGVDIDFWHPVSATVDKSNHVLAIGNDAHRDWNALVTAWGPDLPPLKIVTGLPVPPAPPNVEIIRGDWRTRILEDAEIRRLYQSASFVVVPVRDTIQPSGQSVCLQAMACGRPVICSDIAGLWDRQLLRDGENVLLVRPESPEALSLAVRRLSSDSELHMRISVGGRKLVEEHFNASSMANALCQLVQELLRP
jgi:glycosyltransferase involved in cell wall biosynthesis